MRTIGVLLMSHGAGKADGLFINRLSRPRIGRTSQLGAASTIEFLDDMRSRVARQAGEAQPAGQMALGVVG